MAELPVNPMLSKAIIASEDYLCTDEILTIVPMLSESATLFYRSKNKRLHAYQARKNFVRAGGDHFTLLTVWEQWANTNYSQQFYYGQFLYKSLCRARDIRDQLAGLCERVEVVVRATRIRMISRRSRNPSLRVTSITLRSCRRVGIRFGHSMAAARSLAMERRMGEERDNGKDRLHSSR